MHKKEIIKLNSVVFLIVDKDRRMLLQQRSMDTLIMPGYWAFFGGGIEQGETPFQAVVREAKEEIEYEMMNPQFIFEQDFILHNAKGHMRVFVERFTGDKETLRLQEGRDWGWFTLCETKSLDMIDHDRIVIEKVENYIKQKDEICRNEY